MQTPPFSIHILFSTQKGKPLFTGPTFFNMRRGMNLLLPSSFQIPAAQQLPWLFCNTHCWTCQVMYTQSLTCSLRTLWNSKHYFKHSIKGYFLMVILQADLVHLHWFQFVHNSIPYRFLPLCLFTLQIAVKMGSRVDIRSVCAYT